MYLTNKLLSVSTAEFVLTPVTVRANLSNNVLSTLIVALLVPYLEQDVPDEMVKVLSVKVDGGIFQVAYVVTPLTGIANSRVLPPQPLIPLTSYLWSTPLMLIVVTRYRFVVESNTTFLLTVTPSESHAVAAIYPAPCASGAEMVIKPAAKTPAIPKSVNMAMIIASRFENNAKVLFIKFTKAISGYLINFITALPMPNYAWGRRAATI